jgi:hypothetical protein
MVTTLLKYAYDFGLIDTLWYYANRKRKDALIGKHEIEKIVLSRGNTEMTWVCFLPWRTNISIVKKYNLLPKNSPYIAFQGPISLVDPDPNVSREGLFRLVEEVKKLNLKKFGVLGLSAGNYPAFYIANHFQVNKLVAVCPGARVGSSVWDGIATREVKKRSIQKFGMSETQYDEILGETNPIKNVSNLSDDIEIYLGSHDQYVPTYLGEELVCKLQETGKKPIVHRYKGKGHFLSLLNYGIEQNL